MARTNTPGIVVRHSRACGSRDRRRCNCDPTYEAWVYSKRDGKKIRESFPTLAAARGWRTDALKGVKDKRLRAPSQRTLQQEVDEWVAGTRDARIVNKRDRPYKPAVIRNYELSLRLRVLPELGDRKLADIDLADLLDLKEQLLGKGCSGSTIRNTFVPLQAIYRRARLMGVVPVDPTVDLPLPTSGTRDRAATPEQAAETLSALPADAQAVYALRVRDVDLDAAAISVERGWDDKEGAIDPKSRAGARRVFVANALRPDLEPLLEGRDGDDLVFGSGPVSPFEARALAQKAERGWIAVEKARAEKAEGAGEEPPPLIPRFTLHQARHSFSTWMDHAGVSTRVDRYMGHSSGSVAGRYRHLLPGQLADDRRVLDAYLAGAAAGKVVSITEAASA